VSTHRSDLLDGDLVEQTVDATVQKRDLELEGHGLVLPLLEQLGQALTAGQNEAGGGLSRIKQLANRKDWTHIEIGTELRKGGHITVLRQVELERARDGLHDLVLGGGTDARDRETDAASRLT
jgi:hypothetical protein